MPSIDYHKFCGYLTKKLNTKENIIKMKIANCLDDMQFASNDNWLVKEACKLASQSAPAQNFIRNLRTGDGNEALCLAIYYLLHVHYGDTEYVAEIDRLAFNGKTFFEHTCFHVADVILDSSTDDSSKPETPIENNNANSVDIQNTYLAFTRQRHLDRHSVCGSASISKDNPEPQKGDRIDACLKARISTVYSSRRFHLAFNKARVALRLPPESDGEVEINKDDYDGNGVLCDGAVAKLDSSDLDPIFLISAANEDGILNKTYWFKDKPIARIVPGKEQPDTSLLATLTLSAHAYEDCVLIDNGPDQSDESQGEKRDRTNEQDKVLELLQKHSIEDVEPINGVFLFSEQVLGVVHEKLDEE